ncbi:MAG TPA: site-2 protease family protein [Verrucomicrobiae bacterium]|nr:site-2 protease family protein [Verrucomicrobiae bacterium]
MDRAGQAAVVAATNPGVWRFNLLGFPITVEPWFWLTCFLLGGGLGARGREGIMLIVIWTAVVLVSITIHELGHALAGRKYGARPEIKLHGLGGVAIMHNGYFSRGQSILVSAAGPLASLALGGLVWLIDRAYPVEDFYAVTAVRNFLWVNFFWTAVNLLPILPLDGGQIIRDVLGPRRAQISIWLGVICAVAVGALAIKVGLLFLGIMMFILAFSNFQSQGAQGGVVRD